MQITKFNINVKMNKLEKEFAICLAIAISIWLISIISFHIFGI
jgi:hypothetical protein